MNGREALEEIQGDAYLWQIGEGPWADDPAGLIEHLRKVAREALDAAPPPPDSLEGEDWPERFYARLKKHPDRPWAILGSPEVVEGTLKFLRSQPNVEVARYVPATQPTPSVDEGEAFRLALHAILGLIEDLCDCDPGDPGSGYGESRCVFCAIRSAATQQPAEPTNGGEQ